MAYTKGQKVTLKNATSYESSTTSKAGKKRSGTYYIWSAATKNGRIRVTTKKSYAGKNPASKYVTCWVKTSSIGGSSSGAKKQKTDANKEQKKSTPTKKVPGTSPSSKDKTSTIINIVDPSDVTPTSTANGQIGYLGKVLFIVSDTIIKTLSGFSLTESAKYVEHDRHLKTPRVEFTGVDAAKISFSMTLSQYTGASVWNDFKTLEGYMNGGIAVPLKIGSKSYGKYRWCIQSMTLKGNTTDGSGNWTSVDLSVSLISVEKKG